MYNKTMDNYWIAILYFFIAYALVNFIGFVHYMIYKKFMRMGNTREDSNSRFTLAYQKTIRFQPLYALVIFPVFAGMYLRTLGTIEDMLQVVFTSLIWGVLMIIMDMLTRVIIPHPVAMSFEDFYVKHQPWLIIIYIIVFASPFVAYAILQ